MARQRLLRLPPPFEARCGLHPAILRGAGPAAGGHRPGACRRHGPGRAGAQVAARPALFHLIPAGQG
ncbi:hypothetical protein [Siccirubricoccus phaeus]|uniref:hypothetical protein n=1 Tax=Siccirubricoccus phaeus TaxID=2595053 RepID=UPI0011F3A902|nr:hypothetical protein [Siccirubricoccus phaeus]